MKLNATLKLCYINYKCNEKCGDQQVQNIHSQFYSGASLVASNWFSINKSLLYRAHQNRTYIKSHLHHGCIPIRQTTTKLGKKQQAKQHLTFEPSMVFRSLYLYFISNWRILYSLFVVCWFFHTIYTHSILINPYLGCFFYLCLFPLWYNRNDNALSLSTSMQLLFARINKNIKHNAHQKKKTSANFDLVNSLYFACSLSLSRSLSHVRKCSLCVYMCMSLHLVSIFLYHYPATLPIFIARFGYFYLPLIV